MNKLIIALNQYRKSSIESCKRKARTLRSIYFAFWNKERLVAPNIPSPDVILGVWIFVGCRRIR